MKTHSQFALITALVAAALAGGYWWGRAGSAAPDPAPAATPAATAAAQPAQRRVLYYRNPMGLPDTSPVPKRDQMGMDYIPVYEGEEPAPDDNAVKVSADRLQKLGVRTETVALRDLTRTVRAVGTLQANERSTYAISPRFEGWIERLHVNTTGEPVTKGQPLMDVYSPELVTAQQEYLIAWRGIEAVKDGSPEIRDGMQQMTASALQRLRNWEISETEIERLQKEGTARQTLTLRSPVTGIVIEKAALKGMRFMPGEALYRIADLSTLWLLAEVFEQDLALVRVGQNARVAVNAFPGKTFTGKVTFVYPTLTPQTRTVKVRVELPNPGALLKPEMYGNVELDTALAQAKALVVPDSAVIDSGTRQVVLVQRATGRFESRTVKLGMRGDGFVEVLEGVNAGETVVVSANFLIDSESNLKAALGGFGAPADVGAKAPGPVHRGAGTVDAIDAKAGSITMTHDPIPSLKWPAMTMDFQLANASLLDGLKTGQRVEIEIVQKAPGEFLIVRIAPAVKPAAHSTAHEGH